jgi:hypothetical protein
VLEEGEVIAVEPALYDPVLRSGLRLENDYLVTATGLELLNIEQMMITDPPEIEWVWQDYLAKGTLNLLHGDAGLGKSLISLAIATACTIGGTVLNRETRRSAVAIIDAENSGDEIHRRIRKTYNRISNTKLMHYYRADEAILGLRALYFALAAMVHRFHYLKYALALVLVFIGGKIFWNQIFGKVDPAISLGVTLPRAYETGLHAAQFVVFRGGGLAPVTVHYAVSGSAIPGADFTPLSGSVHFPAGARSALVTIQPLADGLVEAPESVVLSLLPGPGYQVGSPASASVMIDDAADVLYVATLRPPAGAGSGAAGTASLRRAGNSLGSVFKLGFSGLDGAQTAAELLVSDDGLDGTIALELPLAQIPSLSWAFEGGEGLTRGQILAALDGQRLWVRIRSAAVPGGELVGRLQAGWDTMPTPPTPPASPGQSADAGEIARFLAQATFG